MKQATPFAPKTRPRGLGDDALLDLVQRQTFRYFWDFAHPVSGLARERSNVRPDYGLETVTTGGSGFGAMAILVAAERGWIGREDARDRLLRMVRFLLKADSYHGILPHFLNGETGRTIPFTRKDDGGDLARPGGERPLLALEPQQRLEHQPRDPRLERMPDHLRSGGILAALPDQCRRLPLRLGGRSNLQERSEFLRHPAAARAGSWRAAILLPLFFPGAGSARLEGSVCRLLAAERESHADQSRALRSQSQSSQRLWARLLGPHLER
jgi:hypothetical protein